MTPRYQDHTGKSDISVSIGECACASVCLCVRAHVAECVKLFCSNAASFNVAGKAKSLAYFKESGKNRGNERVYHRDVTVRVGNTSGINTLLFTPASLHTCVHACVPPLEAGL